MLEYLSPYLEYKDSNQPCFGKIPKHWKVLRNGQIFSQRNQTGFPDLPNLEVSLKTGVRVRSFETSKRKQVLNDREKYKRVGKGDITYNMMRMWQGAVGAAPVDGLVSPAYVVASPLSSEVDSRYFSYLFRTHTYMNEVNKYSHGIVADRNRLYWDEFKQMPSLFPPSNEQKKIADFLNAHGRKVSQLIRIRKRQIELLRELKLAIINSAVTRGLDSETPLKASGIDWLGDIPEHWEIKPLKNYFHFEKGKNASKYTVTYLADNKGSFPVYSGQTENGGIMGEINTFDYNIDECLFTTTVGAKVMTPKILKGKFNLSQNCLIMLKKSNISLDFFYYQLTGLFNYEKAMIPSHMQPSLRISDLNRYRVALPEDIEEQKSIASFISNQLKIIDKVIEKNHKEIDYITEYRTSLISDVVTGKVDVRDIAIDNQETDIDEIDQESMGNEEIEDYEESEG